MVKGKKKGIPMRQRQRSIRQRMNLTDLLSWLSHNEKKKDVERDDEVELHVHFAQQSMNSGSSNGSLNSMQEQPKYLDGGYGWVVVFYSFVMHFILDGVSFSFGILFPKIQERYSSHRVGASVVASLFLSLPLTFAPMAGMITDAFDCRNTIIAGSIISFLSVLMSSQVNSIYLFTAFFGAGTGIGMSLLYNPAIVIVTYYFSTKRGLATSLAVAGTGFGTMCYPFYQKLMTYLLAGYFTEWTSLLIALCISFALVTAIGIYIKDVEWQSDTKEYKEKVFQKRLNKCIEEEEQQRASAITNFRRSNSLPSIPTIFLVKRMSESVQSVQDAASNMKEQPMRSKSVGIFALNKPKMQYVQEYSMLNNQIHILDHLNLELSNSPCVTVRQKKKKVKSTQSMSVDQINEMDSNEDLRVKMHVGASSSSSSPPPSRSPSPTSSSSSSESEIEGFSSSEDSELSNDGDSSSSDISERPEKELPTVQLNSARLNIPHSARPLGACVPTSARSFRGSIVPGSSGVRAGRVMAANILQPRFPFSNLMTVGKVPSAPTLVTRKKHKSFIHKFNLKEAKNLLIEGLKSSQNLFRKTSFICFMISVFCLYMILDVPYIYFYDYATEYLEIEESKASYISSAIGFANLLSTPVYGLVSDVSILKNNLFLIYGSAMVLVSISIFLTAFATTTTHLLIIGIMFGGSVTANYVMQSILLTCIFKEVEFQSAYSLTSFAEGIAGLIGPIMIGWTTDYLGSYFWVFIGGSFMTFISALFGFFAHLSWKHESEFDRIGSRNSSAKSSNKNVYNWKKNIGIVLQEKGKLKFSSHERMMTLLGNLYTRLTVSGGSNRRPLNNGSPANLETLELVNYDV